MDDLGPKRLLQYVDQQEVLRQVLELQVQVAGVLVQTRVAHARILKLVVYRRLNLLK